MLSGFYFSGDSIFQGGKVFVTNMPIFLPHVSYPQAGAGEAASVSQLPNPVSYNARYFVTPVSFLAKYLLSYLYTILISKFQTSVSIY